MIMRWLIYIVFISLILVIPLLALNNNASTFINNTNPINPLVQSNENIDNSNVNLIKENNYLNLTNLSTPEYGIIESIKKKISQLFADNLIGIISIYLTILLFIIARYIENEKFEQSYTVRAYANKLKPKDFKIKNFEYIRKSSHDTVINLINKNKNKILVKGVTGLGKTRAVFEIIKELGLKTNYYVIIPEQRIKLPILVPKDLFILKRKFILFFDDIDKYVSNETDVSSIINEFENNSKELIILATCREEVYDIVKKERIHELFDIIEYDKLSIQDGIKLAKIAGKEFNPKEFDGTAGSIVLDEHRKKEFYDKSHPSEKNILRAIKLLSLSNIFLPSEQLLMKVHEIIFHPNDDFNTYFIDLKEKKFIDSEKDKVFCAHDSYLSKIVIDYPLGNQLFDNMLELREVLIKLGSYEYLNNLGNAFSSEEKYQDAITCYDKALIINPKMEKILYNKGITLAELGKHNEAIICYDKALEINPKRVEAWIAKGSALAELGKHNEAIVCYNKVLEVNPDEGDWIAKGSALDELGKHNEAIICYDKALEIDPKDEVARFNKGNVLVESGKYNEAITCFDKLLEINPKDEGAWYNKGVALGKSGKYNEAIICFDKALEINPKKEKAWFNKGVALGKSGKYNEAIICYDKALEINPKCEKAWFNIARSYSIIGEKDKALSDLGKAIEFDTSNKEKAKKNEDFKILWIDEDFRKLVA